VALRLLDEESAARAQSLGGEITSILALFKWTPTPSSEEKRTLILGDVSTGGKLATRETAANPWMAKQAARPGRPETIKAWTI
jgi:hypothetical protein